MSGRPPLVLEGLIRDGVVPKNVLKGGFPVICDDVAAYHNFVTRDGTGNRSIVEGMSVRPPYNPTWMEFYDSGASFAVCARSGTMADLDAEMIPTRTIDIRDDVGVVVHPNAVSLDLFTKDAHLAHMVVPCDEGWRPDLNQIRFMLPDMDNHPAEQDVDVMTALTVCPLVALSFFHVKNASVMETTGRAERRQAARGPIGAISRELVIAPLRRTLRAIRAFVVTNPGVGIPKQWVRGHFKTFTSDRPLFGRYIGTYWWDPHFRGDETNGEIRHDTARLLVPTGPTSLTDSEGGLTKMSD